MSSQTPDPVRGAGFAAGRTAAAAARLVADVARASSDSWADAIGVVAQANAFADRLEVLAEADADVFAAALVALATPSAELEPHMQRAAALPLEIAEASSVRPPRSGSRSARHPRSRPCTSWSCRGRYRLPLP